MSPRSWRRSGSAVGLDAKRPHVAKAEPGYLTARLCGPSSVAAPVGRSLRCSPVNPGQSVGFGRLAKRFPPARDQPSPSTRTQSRTAADSGATTSGRSRQPTLVVLLSAGTAEVSHGTGRDDRERDRATTANKGNLGLPMTPRCPESHASSSATTLARPNAARPPFVDRLLRPRGNLDADHVAHYLRGDRTVSESDHNVVALASTNASTTAARTNHWPTTRSDPVARAAGKGLPWAHTRPAASPERRDGAAPFSSLAFALQRRLRR